MRDDVGHLRPPLEPTFTPATCAGIGPVRGPAISSVDIITVRHRSGSRYGEVFKFLILSSYLDVHACSVSVFLSITQPRRVAGRLRSTILGFATAELLLLKNCHVR